MSHRTHTVELKNWFADEDLDLNLNPCYIIRHLIGEEETCYGDIDNGILEFRNRQDAEAFAKHLNSQAVPETYTYSEWGE